MTEIPNPSEVPSGTLSTTDVRTLLGIITEDEFARAVGVVGPTVSIWRNRGEGPPFFRFRRNIFYRTADAVQWIIEQTRDPVTDEFLVPKSQPPITSVQYAGGGKARITRGDGTLELTGDDVAAASGDAATRSSEGAQNEPRGAGTRVMSKLPQAALSGVPAGRVPSSAGSE